MIRIFICVVCICVCVNNKTNKMNTPKTFIILIPFTNFGSSSKISDLHIIFSSQKIYPKILVEPLVGNVRFGNVVFSKTC